MTTGGQLERLLWAAGEARRLRIEAENGGGHRLAVSGPSDSAHASASSDRSDADRLVSS